jgi:hypothetical protein
MNFSPITNDSIDPITGEFANFPTGGSVSVGGRLVQAGYAAGTGNDLQLTVAALPGSPDPDTIPGTQTVTEDRALVLSAGNGNTIAIGGIPVLTTNYKVTLSVNAGATLSLGGLTGLTFVTGDGANDVTMTFTGSLAAINLALQGATVTPAADFNGPVTLTLNWDDQGAATGTPQPATDSTVTINVTPVNDAPSFTKGVNLSVAQNAGAQTVPGWATAISKGPADESSQTVTFHTTVTGNPGLFAVAPQIAADGTLTFTPARWQVARQS